MHPKIEYTAFDDKEYQHILEKGRFSIPINLLLKYIFFVVISLLTFSLFIAYAFQLEGRSFLYIALLRSAIGIAFIALFFFIISSFKRTFYFEKIKTRLDVDGNISTINDFFNFYKIENFPETHHSNVFFAFEQKGRVRFECTFICSQGNILYNARPRDEGTINTSITLHMARHMRKYFRKRGTKM